MTEERKCLNPYCDSTEIYARGLCHACYTQALRLIKNGETTWEKLEAEGKVLPSRTSKKKVHWFK